jgi:hypothetical protein
MEKKQLKHQKKMIKQRKKVLQLLKLNPLKLLVVNRVQKNLQKQLGLAKVLVQCLEVVQQLKVKLM